MTSKSDFHCSQKTTYVSKVPICFVLDTSRSMLEKSHSNKSNLKIDELDEIVTSFLNSVKREEKLNEEFDICIISCGSDSPKIINDFSCASNIVFKHMKPFGRKPLGASVNIGLDLLKKRKSYYKDRGFSFSEPLMIIISDGQTAGLDYGFNNSCKKCVEEVWNWQLVVITIAVGEDARLDILDKFAPEVKTFNFDEKLDIFDKVYGIYRGFLADRPMSQSDNIVFDWLNEQI